MDTNLGREDFNHTFKFVIIAENNEVPTKSTQMKIVIIPADMQTKTVSLLT